MILTNRFHTDKYNHENVMMTSLGFPHACYKTDINHYAGHAVAWHWHAALELTFVREGELTIETSNYREHLNAGSLVFINTGVLHTYKANPQMPCSVYAHLFDMRLISGSTGSVFEEKYILPICHSTLEAFVIRPDSSRHLRMISHFLEAVDSARDEQEGYEFQIRESLSRIWIDLLSETEEARARAPMRNTADAERIKKMLSYIEEHYPDQITAQDIADAAGISVRESSRCFNRSIGYTPLNYLTWHRIKIASEMLATTQKSVIEVSEECGFSSPSYFAKIFRELMGDTPKSYQLRNRRNTAAIV